MINAQTRHTFTQRRIKARTSDVSDYEFQIILKILAARVYALDYILGDFSGVFMATHAAFRGRLALHRGKEISPYAASNTCGRALTNHLWACT